MAKKKRLSKAEKQKRENLKWIFMFVILVLTITVYLAAFIESDKTQASIDFNKKTLVRLNEDLTIKGNSTMRRTFDSKFKARVALEAIKEEKTIADIANQYEIHPNQVSAWKKEALQKMPDLFQDGRKKQKSKEPDITRDDIFKEVGVLKVENEFLKKSTGNCTERTLPCRGGES